MSFERSRRWRTRPTPQIPPYQSQNQSGNVWKGNWLLSINSGRGLQPRPARSLADAWRKRVEASKHLQRGMRQAEGVGRDGPSLALGHEEACGERSSPQDVERTWA